MGRRELLVVIVLMLLARSTHSHEPRDLEACIATLDAVTEFSSEFDSTEVRQISQIAFVVTNHPTVATRLVRLEKTDEPLYWRLKAMIIEDQCAHVRNRPCELKVVEQSICDDERKRSGITPVEEFLHIEAKHPRFYEMVISTQGETQELLLRRGLEDTCAWLQGAPCVIRDE